MNSRSSWFRRWVVLVLAASTASAHSAAPTESDAGAEIGKILSYLREQRFDEAVGAAGDLEKKVKSSGSASDRVATGALRQHVNWLADGWKRAETARKKLALRPDSKSDNGVVGRFYALRLRDWSAAAPYLAKSDEKLLAAAVEMEIAASAAGEHTLELGEKWSQVAQAMRGEEAALAKSRAMEVFQQSLSDVAADARGRLLQQIGEAKMRSLDTRGMAPVPLVQLVSVLEQGSLDKAIGVRLISFKRPDRRNLTYFHIDFTFDNQSANARIDGRLDGLNVKVRALLRDGDRRWNVLQWEKPVELARRGTQEIGLGGAFTNAQVKTRNAGSEDAQNVYVQYRFGDTLLQECFLTKNGPAGWWLDDSLLDPQP